MKGWPFSIPWPKTKAPDYSKGFVVEVKNVNVLWLGHFATIDAAIDAVQFVKKRLRFFTLLFCNEFEYSRARHIFTLKLSLFQHEELNHVVRIFSTFVRAFFIKEPHYFPPWLGVTLTTSV